MLLCRNCMRHVTVTSSYQSKILYHFFYILPRARSNRHLRQAQDAGASFVWAHVALAAPRLRVRGYITRLCGGRADAKRRAYHGVALRPVDPGCVWPVTAARRCPSARGWGRCLCRVHHPAETPRGSRFKGFGAVAGLHRSLTQSSSPEAVQVRRAPDQATFCNCTFGVTPSAWQMSRVRSGLLSV